MREKVLDKVDSALKLAKESKDQSIQVRGAIVKLETARAALAGAMKEEVVDVKDVKPPKPESKGSEKKPENKNKEKKK